VRESAPPYVGEGPYALWHMSEERSIRRFEPHRAYAAEPDEPLVWAIDTRHQPLFSLPSGVSARHVLGGSANDGR
jgi:uncharacterized protein DUF6886